MKNVCHSLTENLERRRANPILEPAAYARMGVTVSPTWRRAMRAMSNQIAQKRICSDATF